MKRYEHNPIITRQDIPAVEPHLVDVSSVFNPGAVKFGDKYLLLLRVQNRGRETHLMVAESDDGRRFSIRNTCVRFNGLEQVNRPIYHLYDPRITQIDSRYYIMMAMDMKAGCRLGLAVTDDFESFQFLGVEPHRDMRNGVLFPEKIGDSYVRLDRPNTGTAGGGVASGSTICVSTSENLVDWTYSATLMHGRPHFWDELIGSGPPPVKTREGWLHVYHGIATHFAGVNIYQAGVVLLDLDDPTKVKARSRYNILEPRELCEQVGQVPNVVFPSGMIVEQFDSDGFAEPESEVLLYYGAADTCVCLATTTIDKLIAACHAGEEKL